jgi:AcrR family transcriptional regulator/DNA-binding MarR family transcriptional regulator
MALANRRASAGGGGLYVGELQRSRLLEAAFAVVGEQGYAGMTVRRVAERAGVSPKTFYALFSDREDCFLAAFDHAVEVLAGRVRPVYDAEREWTARVRAGLGALLVCLDEEPALRRLLIVEALVAGERVLERRARVLDALAGLVDEGRGGMRSPGELPPLAAEGVVGATFGVIHVRLSQRRPEPLVDLLGALMATIVLPYRGSKAAARELAHPAPSGLRGASRSKMNGPAHPAKCAPHTSEEGRRPIVQDRPAPPIASLRPLGSTLPADFRLTVRTQAALVAVARLSAGGASPNNREVSELMGVADQGQVSRLMMRLTEQGLVENTRGHTKRLEKAWRLTPHGEAVLDAHRGGRAHMDGREALRGGKLASKRGRVDAAPARPASAGFRLTVRTHMVLSAVAEHAGASNREIADAAGVRDEGQISKLLSRLEGHGLLQNTGGSTQGVPRAWRLTSRGEEIVRVGRPRSERADGHADLSAVKR